MKKTTKILTVIAISILSGNSTFCYSGIKSYNEQTRVDTSYIQATKSFKYLKVTGSVPKGTYQVNIQIYSDRNSKISKMTDISPNHPHPEDLTSNLETGREIWYPVVDVVPETGMEGILIFGNDLQGSCIIGGPFYSDKFIIKDRMAISAERLEYWENSVFTEPSNILLKNFYLSMPLCLVTKEFEYTFQLLSEDWSGKISVTTMEESHEIELASCRIDNSIKTPEKIQEPKTLNEDLSTERLLHSLIGSVYFTLKSQNQNPHSPTSGGISLFYDLDAKLYRTSYWMWGWGPSVKLLLEAAKIPAVTLKWNPDWLQKKAAEIGDASLRFQVHDSNLPIDGAVIGRYDRELKFETGYKKDVTVSDANFLSAWAWIPLYEATGDMKYLNAAIKLAKNTEELMNKFDIIPQDYYYDEDTWSSHVLNESGFGVEGLAELYRITGNPEFQKLGVRYIEQHLSKLQRKDGLWERSWKWEEKKVVPTVFHARAQGWAMEGLLATHFLSPDKKKYLDLAEKMAGQMMKWQQPEGFWYFKFNGSDNEKGISEKGTALWCLLFYRLYKFTGNEQYLDTARKALRWCLDNQYFGSDQEAYGSIVGRSHQSAVGYRQWFNVSCSYSSAFFGLAIIEELKLTRSINF